MDEKSILAELRNKIPKIKLEDNIEYETINTYDFIDGVWISSIAVYDNKLVLNSNHFINLILNGNDFAQETGIYSDRRKPSYIYSRIIKNYYRIIKDQKTLSNLIVIEDRCIFLHNSFSSGNAGHDLFCILNILMKYKDDLTLKFILFDEIGFNNNIFIINLFIDDSRIIKIQKDKIYKFKKLLFIFEKDCHNAKNYSTIFNEIVTKLKEKANNEISSDEVINLQNKKVIIIKNHEMTKIIRKEDCFNAVLLFNYLRSKDWYICNPEIDNFLKLAYILMNAKVIITADRGISCANQYLYNMSAQIIGFQINNKNHNRNRNNNSDFYITNDISFTKYDIMCNSLYHHLIKKVILSPLNITVNNMNQIETVINTI